MQGIRWLDKLRAHLDEGAHSGHAHAVEIVRRDGAEQADRRQAWRTLLRMLDDPNTKRLLFDSRQAAVFTDLDAMEAGQQRRLHVPFNQFYLELTDPILAGEPEPGYEGRDRLRALLYTNHEPTVQTVEVQYEDDPGSGDIEMRKFRVSQLTLFFETDHDGGSLVERSFTYCLDNGLAFVRPETVQNSADPSTFLGRVYQDVPPGRVIVAGRQLIDEGRQRHVGWWERACISYASLFGWMLAYTMSKSIHIYEEPMSRQQRRWHERKRITPKPWHIIRVDPKFITQRQGEPAIGSKHSYRYDVIGHLRWGRHPKKDGSYTEAWEWVEPHQRGLDNAVYIPATHQVKRGKRIAPAMRRYFGGGTE